MTDDLGLTAVVAPHAPVVDFFPRGKAPLPEVVYVELADYCNLSCTFCERSAYVDSVGKGGFIDVEMFQKLEQPLRAAKYLGLSGRIGEPLIHPRLETILKWVYSVNPNILLRITTNGTALGPKLAELLGGHIDFLAISLNASNAEAYFRDMRPVGVSRANPAAWFDNFTGRIRDFIAALPEGDRGRIRMIAPVQRDNIHDANDFVRLVASMGGTHAIFTPMHVHEDAKIEQSVYWFKDRYNDVMDEAAALGATLGLRVEAARFYANPKYENLDLETLCREPVESAYLNMEKLGTTAPCCHWSEDAIPMDVYSDEGAFERFWNSDLYQNLRRKRDFRSCKNCSMGRAFDEMLFHFTPALQYRLAAAGKIAAVEAQNVYPDSELAGACRKLTLDLRSLRRATLALGVPTERLDAFKRDGLDALPEIDRDCWNAFTALDTPIGGGDVALGGSFTGMGWAEPDNDPATKVSARWMGGGRVASVFFRVEPGHAYQIRVTAHHLNSPEMIAGLHLAVCGSSVEVQRCPEEDGTTVVVAEVPEQTTTAYGGRLWLAIRYDDSHGQPGWVSFSRVAATKIERPAAAGLWNRLKRLVAARAPEQKQPANG